MGGNARYVYHHHCERVIIMELDAQVYNIKNF